MRFINAPSVVEDLQPQSADRLPQPDGPLYLETPMEVLFGYDLFS